MVAGPHRSARAAQAGGGRQGARSWLERKAEVDPEWGTAELRTLETLVSEGQRLPIAVPQLKVTACTQRLNSVLEPSTCTQAVLQHRSFAC